MPLPTSHTFLTSVSFPFWLLDPNSCPLSLFHSSLPWQVSGTSLQLSPWVSHSDYLVTFDYSVQGTELALRGSHTAEQTLSSYNCGVKYGQQLSFPWEWLEVERFSKNKDTKNGSGPMPRRRVQLQLKEWGHRVLTHRTSSYGCLSMISPT